MTFFIFLVKFRYRVATFWENGCPNDMVNDNTSEGITFDGIYRIETDIISDVTDV